MTMEQQKFYVTRFWQTTGIKVVYGKLYENRTVFDGKTHTLEVPVKTPHYEGDAARYYGNDYWCTKEEAIAHVEKEREKLIKSAEKKLDKLKAIVVVDLIKDDTEKTSP